MSNINSEVVIRKLKLSEQIATELSDTEKNALMCKYDALAESILKNNNIYKSNAASYAQLLNATVFLTMLLTNAYKIIDYPNLSTMLTPANSFTPGTKVKDIKTILQKMVTEVQSNGVVVPSDTSVDNIRLVLSTFDVDSIDTNDVEDMDSLLDEQEENIDLSNLEFNIDDVLDDNGESAEDIKEDTDNEKDIDEEESDDNKENTEDVSINNEKDIEEDEEEEEEDLSKKQAVEALKKNDAINGMITRSSKEIVNVLVALYKSGFEGLPSIGIMVDTGNNANGEPIPSRMVGIDRTTYRVKPILSKDIVSEMEIYQVLYENLKSMTEIAPTTQKEKCVPSAETIINGTIAVCPNLHLAFQSANIKFTTGIISIRKWIREQIKKDTSKSIDTWLDENNNGNKVALCNVKHIISWYQWAVEEIIYHTLVDIGFKGSMTEIGLLKKVVTNVNNLIINVVSVADRRQGVEVTLKVATNEIGMNTDAGRASLVSRITRKINTQGSNAINVTYNNLDDPHVFSLSVVYDAAEAAKSVVFAADILDNIVAGGNPPSWNNALLGKKQDGSYLYWNDFMNPAKAMTAKRCYAIYAGMRSGKGVMTSTLIASALCDKKQVFYTDGKPENGACLGRLAWRDGKEAYVFDGNFTGAIPFHGHIEDYTFGVRTADEVTDYLDNLPKCLFENSEFFDRETQRKFLGLMRYLKSLMLCFSIMSARAEGTVLDKGNWQIWIFDEAQYMCNIEQQIRNKFIAFVNKTLQKNSFNYNKTPYEMENYLKKEDAPNKEGIQYILNWLKWNDEIIKLLGSANTVNFGKSDMNLIFIFQKAEWLSDGDKGFDPNCTIKKIVSELQCTKIVGNDAIFDRCKFYGDGTTKNKEWYSDCVNKGKGWWAISQSNDIRSSDVTLFKPYSLWTIPLRNGGNDIVEDTSGMDQHEKNKYLEGYVDTLLGAYGITASDLLQSSFDYAENAVKQLGFAGNLKEFIYDCANFASSEVDNSFEGLRDELREASEKVDSNKHEDGFIIDTDEEERVVSLSKNDEKHGISLDKHNEDDERHEEVGDDEDITIDFGTDSKDDEDELVLNKLSPTKMLMDQRCSESTIIAYMNGVAAPLLQKIAAFEISNREENANKGLKAFATLISNIHCATVVRKAMSLGGFSTFLVQLANQNNTDGTSVKAKIALGLLSDYASGTLQYDTMPEVGRIKQYLVGQRAGEQTTNQSNIDFNSFNEDRFDLNEDGSLEFGDEATPDERVSMREPFFTSMKDGETKMLPRDSQTVIIPTKEEFQDVKTPKYSIIGRFSKKLFESKNGTAYEFKKRWDYVLEAISDKFPQRGMITRIVISGGTMAVNGKQIRLDNVLGGPYDVRLEDIISIKALLKKFRMVQSLTLDSEATQNLIMEYGPDVNGVLALFSQNKTLRTLGIIPAGTNKPVVYNRQTLMAEQQKLKQQLEVEQTKMKIEHFAATKNPKLSKKSSGYTARFFKGSTGLSGSLFKGAGSAIKDKNPKLVKATVYSLAGTAIIAVGGVVGLFGLAGKGVGKLFGLFKR